MAGVCRRDVLWRQRGRFSAHRAIRATGGTVLRSRQILARAGAACLAFALLSIGAVAPAPAADKSPVNVGIIYSKTGLLGVYGNEYLEGFQIGLDYATHGTGMAGGHKIVVSERDDAGDPAKAVAAAKDLIGQGYKILAGSTASGVALQMAPLAKENNILFISGAAAADGVTGNNRNTFRSGRQTYQDVLTAGTIIGTNLRGKKVVVFAQDFSFGQANVAAVRAVLGASGGDVSGILAPLSTNDYTPFAQKIKDAKPDLLFIAWAGTSGGAMFKSLDDGGVFAATRTVTGLDQTAAYPIYAPMAGRLQFLAHYFYQASHTKANEFLIAAMKKQGKVPEIFDNDGFVAAQMIVHAIEKADGDDVAKTIPALEGWSFEGPKGPQTVRAADHAMIQVMFVCQLTGSGATLAPKLLRTVPANAVAPPVRPFK
jgi:branched-chain amino acid transport system substrate-binding protein